MTPRLCTNSPLCPLVPCGVLSPRVRDIPVQLRVDDATAASMVKGVRGKDLGEINWLRDAWLKGWLLERLVCVWEIKIVWFLHMLALLCMPIANSRD